MQSIDPYCAEDLPRNTQLQSILSAYDEYQQALVTLFDRLELDDCCVQYPEMIAAGLIVAQLTGGVALPSRDLAKTVEVIGADGSIIQVMALSGALQMDSGMVVYADNHDTLAIVAFLEARPVVVHFIPSARLGSVARELGCQRGLNRLAVTMSLHFNLMLERATAAAMGVVTVELDRQGTT